MGYNTTYRLETEPKIELTEETLETMSGGYYWSKWKGNWMIEESVKWYDYDEHMRKFSKKKEHKDILFKLSGEGEESGDIWRAYYKNGKCQTVRAELQFEPFDESKLR